MLKLNSDNNKCTGDKFFLRKEGLFALLVICLIIPYFYFAFPLAFLVQRSISMNFQPKKMWECELVYFVLSVVFVIILVSVDAFYLDKFIAQNLSTASIIERFK